MKKALFTIILLLQIAYLKAQNVTITPSGITPALSGSYPRISYDAILALPSPVRGDIAYDTTFDCLRVYNGNKWICTYTNPSDFTPNLIAITSAGGTSSDIGKRIAVDAAGNVYITGFYSGTTNFGTTSKTSAGGDDIFVAKYNTNGSLQWVQSAGGVSSDRGNGIAVDAAGNIYITGFYSSTANFGATTKTSAGGYDIFVAKYNTSGSLQWVQSAGGTSTDIGNGIAVDAAGNVYITGYYSGTATFGTASKTSAGGDDIFVAKYNTSGSLQWVQSAGGTSTDIGNGIAVDAAGNVYITGYYAGTANFGATSKTSAGIYDIFVAKYNPVGVSWDWVQSAGGTSPDEGNGIAVDAAGNVYITGYYQGTANFGATSKASAGSNDIFVAKYNTNGSLQWVQSAGGVSSDAGNGIAVDVAGNIYMTGYYAGTANFGATSKTSAGGYDIFVAKYSTSGSLQWVQSAGGTSYDEGNGIAVDAAGNVYMTGYYEGTATFGATSKISAGGTDTFVVRLDK